MAGIGDVINDFAKRPAQFKVAVFGALIVVMVAVYWQFLLSPIAKEREELEGAISGLNSESGQLVEKEKKYRELLKQREDDELLIKTMERVLPSDADLPAFFEMLDRRFSEAGVEAKSVARKPEVTVGEFKKVPVDIEISGNYFQIKRFFASLIGSRPVDGEQPDAKELALEQDRIVTVENFSLKRLSGAKGADSADVLVAKFTAATFRREAAAPVGGPTPAKPPAARPAGPATPAAGAAGAGNPVQKSKTDTTKALDKSETRATGGAGKGGGQ